MISWFAVAGAVSVLLACGSSPSTSGGARTSTRSPANAAALAAYIARGDEVCRAGNEAIAPVNARGAEIERRYAGSPREVALLVPVLRHGLRDYNRFDKRLERIPPPPEEAAAVAGILAGLKRVGTDLERLTGALAAGEPATVRTIRAELETDHIRVSAQELEFGFKVCGQPAEHPSIAP